VFQNIGPKRPVNVRDRIKEERSNYITRSSIICLSSSPNNVKVVRSVGMKWTDHVACVVIKLYNILVLQRETKSLVGRHIFVDVIIILKLVLEKQTASVV
jgi:hypothetical protein